MGGENVLKTCALTTLLVVRRTRPCECSTWYLKDTLGEVKLSLPLATGKMQELDKTPSAAPFSIESYQTEKSVGEALNDLPVPVHVPKGGTLIL